jgi:shikimate dehydrogenase
MSSNIKLSLIGKDIAHSKSPHMYRQLLDVDFDYDLLDISEEAELPTACDLLEQYAGVSITAPYKKHYLSQVELDDDVKELGAINCLYKKDDKLFGANTDYLAVKESLEKILSNNPGLKIYLLGNGSMSRITKHIFKSKSLTYVQLARSVGDSPKDLDLVEQSPQDSCLIINSCAREFEFMGQLKDHDIYWDYNYSLPQQQKYVEGFGARYICGEGILFRQAELALKLWGLDHLKSSPLK